MDGTEKLRLAVYSENKEKSLFPEHFISSIRDCLDEGISAKQLSVMVSLCSCVMRFNDVDMEELVGRVLEVAHVMANTKARKERLEKERKVM